MSIIFCFIKKYQVLYNKDIKRIKPYLLYKQIYYCDASNQDCIIRKLFKKILF